MQNFLRQTNNANQKKTYSVEPGASCDYAVTYAQLVNNQKEKMSKILKNQNRGSFINQAFDLAPKPDLDTSLAGVQ